MIITEKPFKRFHVGQRVLFTGRTSYNYAGDGSKGVNKEPGTIINIGNCIVVELDEYRHPYFTKSPGIVTMDNIYTVPPRQYGIVGIGDLACGDKKLEPM